MKKPKIVNFRGVNFFQLMIWWVFDDFFVFLQKFIRNID